MRPEQTPRSPASLLDQGSYLSVIKTVPGTSPLGYRTTEGAKLGYGLAYIPQISAICRNDACDWLVVSGNDNLLTLRHALEKRAESKLRLKCGHSGIHGLLSDY